MEIREEDVARLSPLGYRHIHLQGRYNVPLSEAAPPAGFRALRTATGSDEASDDYSA